MKNSSASAKTAPEDGGKRKIRSASAQTASRRAKSSDEREAERDDAFSPGESLDDEELIGAESREEDIYPLDDLEERGALPPGADEDEDLPLPSESRLPRVNAARDNLHLYLREIGRFPMLTPEEEFSLASRARDSSDPDAAFRLVSSHLRLVVRIAMDFQRRWMQNVLDLVQEGNVGLLRAVNKFDPDKGIKFSYYASFWIKAYILKFIMDNWRMVKIGTTQAQRKLFYNLNRERQKLIAQGYDPDAKILSERLGVSSEQVREMEQRLSSTDVSLNLQVGEDSGSSTRMDFLPALGPAVEESLASREISSLIRSQMKLIMPRLNEKEKYILEHRLLAEEPITLREIGERYNVTRERVRQLEARLLDKIRKHLTVDIKDFSEEWIES
ncbi:MAG: RNA polymerase factor sigma-32 [Desulfovibrio sp.]|nr:RNA polymerase factor sigma-32 [Desulfovibrio sp.]